MGVSAWEGVRTNGGRFNCKLQWLRIGGREGEVAFAYYRSDGMHGC